MMALRVALPAADVAAIIRKRPQLLLDQVCHSTDCNGIAVCDSCRCDILSKGLTARQRLGGG